MSDDAENQVPGPFRRFYQILDHPATNLAVLAWGLFLAIVWATVRDDVFLLVKASEIVGLALGRLLLLRHTRWFFWGLLVTGLAIPVALYTTSPIFWGEFLPIFSGDALQVFVIGLLCAAPLVFLAIWGLRRKAPLEETPSPDPPWFRWVRHLFSWTLAALVLSFHLANPPLIILGILAFLAGMICLALVRLKLTRRQVGNLIMIIGAGSLVVVMLLVPLGIAHIDGEEAVLAIAPAVVLILVGFFVRASRPRPK